VKRGKLLTFDIPSKPPKSMQSIVLNRNAFLHRRLNVALMYKAEAEAEVALPAVDGATAAAGAAGAATGGAVGAVESENGNDLIVSAPAQDILVAEGSMSLRGAAYQEGHVASLSLLLKDAQGHPMTRVSINVQVNEVENPNKEADDEEEAERLLVLQEQRLKLRKEQEERDAVIAAAEFAAASADADKASHTLDEEMKKLGIIDDIAAGGNDVSNITNGEGDAQSQPITAEEIERKIREDKAAKEAAGLKLAKARRFDSAKRRKKHAEEAKKAITKALELQAATGANVHFRLSSIPDEAFTIQSKLYTHSK
jgi:hypothetical protein